MIYPLPQPAVEHLRAIVARALEYVDLGDPDTALDSFASDLWKRPHADQRVDQFDVLSIVDSFRRGRAATEQVMRNLGLAAGAGWYMVVTDDGKAQEFNEPATLLSVNHAVGAGGHDRIPLSPSTRLAAWLNDGAVLATNADRFRRTRHGAAMCASLGGALQVYAGPIVFTGWESRPVSGNEIRPLDEAQRAHLRGLFADVEAALHDAPTRRPREWAGAIVEYVRQMMEADAPTLGVRPLTVEEALHRLGVRTTPPTHTEN